MPTLPAGPCRQPGCPHLQPCPAHKPTQANGAQRRRARGNPRSGWEEQARNRRTIRQHHGICYLCGQPGATEVDHVIPLRVTGPAGDVETNRRPAHHLCHVEKTRAEQAR